MTELLPTDPVTLSWLLVLLVFAVVVVALPLVRLILAGAVYGVAAISGRQHLRTLAGRLMPRLGHLLGSAIVGIASIASPAIAGPDTSPVSIDRDGGSHAATDVTPTPMAPDTATASATLDTPTALYVVRSGDSLWTIAASQRPNATDAQITETWKAIWRANRQVIGDHPERIAPGMTLAVQDVIA